MKLIGLTKGYVAIVDDEDFEALNAHNWMFNSHGYATRNIPHPDDPRKQTTETMHRRIMGLKHGDKLDVDHISGLKIDNRRSNLRVCTRSQNVCNTPVRADNRCGLKGVSKAPKGSKWRATIFFKGKQKYLGAYDTPEEAHEVYCLWADMFHGEFANHGRRNSMTPTQANAIYDRAIARAKQRVGNDQRAVIAEIVLMVLQDRELDEALLITAKPVCNILRAA